MIHQKRADYFITRRNLSTWEKPFSETVHILHVEGKNDLVLFMITLGVVEFSRVETRVFSS
jgi:hypothetical protein